jgi:hypothetical protein
VGRGGLTPMAEEERTPPPPLSPPDDGTVPCELCGAPVLERHCKIVCRNCGYMRDCSDP